MPEGKPETEKRETKRMYNCKVVKIRPEQRDTYREFASDYCEHHGGDDGESVPVGGEARYAVSLDEAGAEAFRAASNLLEMEEAATDVAYEAENSGEEVFKGVDRDALKMHRVWGSAKGVLTMVADTGATKDPYVAKRLVDKWTWFSDDAMDRNGHGSWCLGAALAAGGKIISAKVLGDSGSGSSSYGIAALYRFARYCRDRGLKGVASLSLGSPNPSEAYREAVEYCFANGVVVLGAAGNDGHRDRISYPGVYAVSVGAMDRSYRAAGFSNRSRTEPDLYALGVSVDGIGGVKSGTSMATPIAARATAIALASGQEAQVLRKLLRSHAGTARILDAKRLKKG